MLFTFGKFWKTLLILSGAWALYGVVGYEFTVISLLALILISQGDDPKI
jgi:hypothetical protein